MSVVGAARRLAGGIGAGAVAGVVGTAAMTLSSTLEARIRGREPSTAPARAAERVLGIEKFGDDAAETRFSNLVHWGYGTGWGVARGVLGATGLGATVAAPLHFAAMWGGATVMLPSLQVAPPVTQWGREEVAIDVFHHLVYATATGLTYGLIAHPRDEQM